MSLENNLTQNLESQSRWWCCHNIKPNLRLNNMHMDIGHRTWQLNSFEFTQSNSYDMKGVTKYI